MSYAGSVSQTLNVQVTLPVHYVVTAIFDLTISEYRAGTLIVDGISHSVQATPLYLYLEEGPHTFNLVEPSGHEFTGWRYGYLGEDPARTSSQRPFTVNIGSDFYVQAMVQPIVIETTLSISLVQPPPVEPSSSLTFTGKLTRSDTGAGLAGQAVTLEQPPGEGIAIGATDANGNYSITVTAPTTDGTYQYRTSFAGSSGLSASRSATMGIGVGAPSALPILAILGAAYLFLKK